MPAALTHQEQVLRVGILRAIDAHDFNLEGCSEWMRGQIADLILHDPMLITVRKDEPVLTEAGREYLLACDPKPEGMRA